MKLFLIFAVATLAVADKLGPTYLPASPRAQTAGGSGNILKAPLLGSSFSGIPNNGATFENSFDANRFASNNNYFGANSFNSADDNNLSTNGNNVANGGSEFNGFNSFDRPERPQAAFERNAAIFRQYNRNDGETYEYGFETENGITAEESGVATDGVRARGSYSYIGDDGQVYSVTYTADENGFVPQGAHIPTAPPVPEEIQKALDQNARDEAAGIFDDGSYDARKYGTAIMPTSFARNGLTFNGNNLLPIITTVTDDAVITNSALTLDNDFIRPPGYKNKGKNGTQKQVPAFQGAQALQGSFQSDTGLQSSGINQGTAAVFSPQADFSANRAYLPPRRSFNRNGVGFNGRRPSYDERTGYRY